MAFYYHASFQDWSLKPLDHLSWLYLNFIRYSEVEITSLSTSDNRLEGIQHLSILFLYEILIDIAFLD